jgi:hypothetical protein
VSDYAPKYLYADQITATTSAAVTGGQLLIVTGDGTVGPGGNGSAGTLFVGVAAHDAAQGARVSYFPRGKVHVSVCENAVAAAGAVSLGSDGKVDDDGGSSPTVGVFLTSAGQGETAEWMEL